MLCNICIRMYAFMHSPQPPNLVLGDAVMHHDFDRNQRVGAAVVLDDVDMGVDPKHLLETLSASKGWGCRACARARHAGTGDPKHGSGGRCPLRAPGPRRPS